MGNGWVLHFAINYSKSILMGTKTKAATTYLMFASLSDIMLNNYQHTSLLKQYDPNLEIKLKNLKVNFERVTAKAYSLFNEEEQLCFFNLIRIFEQLIEAASDTKDFSELTAMIDSWSKNELTMIHTKEDLLDTAKMVENKDSTRVIEVDEEWFEGQTFKMDVVECCKIGPITDQKHCSNCGKLIIRDK